MRTARRKQGDIDGTVAQLLKEKEDENKHKDFLRLQDREKEDLIAKIEDLEFTMKTLSTEIDNLRLLRCRCR